MLHLVVIILKITNWLVSSFFSPILTPFMMMFFLGDQLILGQITKKPTIIGISPTTWSLNTLTNYYLDLNLFVFVSLEKDQAN
jgi:hypothetical protein